MVDKKIRHSIEGRIFLDRLLHPSVVIIATSDNRQIKE